MRNASERVARKGDPFVFGDGMAKVTGIGGVFFCSIDLGAMALWYWTNLGVVAGFSPWAQQAEPTVFAPFAADSDIFGADQQVMLNLRVDDLDGLVANLRDAGITVETRPEWDGAHGEFARIHDPEGRAIELWQPL